MDSAPSYSEVYYAPDTVKNPRQPAPDFYAAADERVTDSHSSTSVAVPERTVNL